MPETDPAYMGMIGTLAGVVIANSYNLLTDHFRSRRQKQTETCFLVREKLEELSVTAEDLAQKYRDFQVYVTQITGQGGADNTTIEIPREPWSRLRGLIIFYAPNLMDIYHRMQGVKSEISKSASILVHPRSLNGKANKGSEKKAQKELMESAASFLGSINEMIELSEELQNEIATRFRRHFGKEVDC